ncbi:hypothetical protein [Listeria fleischmannii]|uniref:hypothetical protein n=1 Tax=Listeria fleischmannii TaxID=1069827 RepID=UPI0002BC62B4|nr:hypothetical protein [Listeria fleischmannii]EMG28278.1 hypothetical protein LFLEISCH_06636 [Listeria fleischmannii subsp. fleischmannii LU2006-1]
MASRFQNQVILFEMKEANLNEEDLLAKKIDFILADFATENYTCVPTVEVNYFPSERDWRNIRKKIHSVTKKKKMARDE